MTVVKRIQVVSPAAKVEQDLTDIICELETRYGTLTSQSIAEYDEFYDNASSQEHVAITIIATFGK